jgi:hypothetical protein
VINYVKNVVMNLKNANPAENQSMNKITGKELGGLLFSIHHHIDEDGLETGNQRARIVYFEEDVLKLLEALGLPKVEWGECIDVDQFKKNVDIDNKGFYTYLRHKLKTRSSWDEDNPVDSIMICGEICDHDGGFLCDHRLEWLINEIKEYFEKK